jgi:hypothetical protein
MMISRLSRNNLWTMTTSRLVLYYYRIYREPLARCLADYYCMAVDAKNKKNEEPRGDLKRSIVPKIGIQPLLFSWTRNDGRGMVYKRIMVVTTHYYCRRE